MLIFQKGDYFYLFSFDLKLGYHHIDTYEPHRQYLDFSWESHGLAQFYFSQYYHLVYVQLFMPLISKEE